MGSAHGGGMLEENLSMIFHFGNGMKGTLGGKLHIWKMLEAKRMVSCERFLESMDERVDHLKEVSWKVQEIISWQHKLFCACGSSGGNECECQHS